MSKNVKILIAALLVAWLLLTAIEIKAEYARITTRIEETQIRIDAVADESKAAIADIRKVIKTMQQWLTKIAMDQDAGLTTEASPAVPVIASVIVPTIVMHSGYDCGPCNAWIANEMQRWTQSGWRVNVVKEIESQRSWPWYEITDRDGSKFEVIGPLTNDTFHSARRGK
jgi:hypothetical protein